MSRLHLHPEAVTERAGDSILVHRGGEALAVVPFGPPPVRLSFEEGWHCPELGVRRRTQVLALRTRGRRVLTGYVLSTGREPAPDVVLEASGIRVRAGGREYARRAP